MTPVELPATFKLADDEMVPLAVGQVLYNYYDMEVVTIAHLPTHPQPCTLHPGETAWWIVTECGNSLDGSRMCTLATARKKGWLKD